MFGKLEVVMKN